MARGWFHDVTMLARLARELPSFLRSPVTLDQGFDIIRRRLATREERFLQIAAESIYGYPRSPYLRLLRMAGCELGDLKSLVAREGLDGTLSHLVRAGVYVAVDEFKGRRVAVRGSQQFAFTEEDFDNPRLRPHFEARSGGTRSPGTAVKTALPYLADLAASTALAFHAHGLWHHAQAIWLNGGVTPMLVYAKLGRAPDAWFYSVQPLSIRAHAGARYLAALSGLSGIPLPRPVFHDLYDPAGMAGWLAARLREGQPICVTTYASSAVRICVAARERGLDLRGLCFITLGEPYTVAKQQVIESVGARTLVRYAFTEAGILGYGCADSRTADDLHFLCHSYALVQRSRAVGDSGVRVDAYLFTSLLWAAPKILVNVESGDCGMIHLRSCACALGAVGLTTHLEEIRSFEKLSNERMSFVETDLLRILEEMLPARFGGASSDYQLVEEERLEGSPRLWLLASPGIGPLDEAKLRETFLRELEGGGGRGRVAEEVWRRMQVVEVKREYPVVTTLGKILPFHLIQGGHR
jgi:hypothetical protein